MNEELKKQLPHTYVVLTKMCSVIKAPIPNFSEPNWFHKHTWNKREQKMFRDWLIQELKDNEDLRFEISRYPAINNKKYREKLANSFIFSYGWKNEEE